MIGCNTRHACRIDGAQIMSGYANPCFNSPTQKFNCLDSVRGNTKAYLIHGAQ